MAISLLILAGVEGLCVLFDWGRPAQQEDPFVGFTDIHPLFVLNDAGTEYEIPKPRRKYFAPDSFPAQKDANTFRIFCLGGSTVQGNPYSKETSFTTFLRLALEAADPSRNWEVVNCGGVSYASYRLIPILEECLTHQPDLIILCSGHNEFLEDRTYDHIKFAPVPVVEAHRLLSHLRSYNLYRTAIASLIGRAPPSDAAQRPLMKDEVDALLDHRGGLEVYERDETWRSGVIAHYGFNLQTMVDLAKDAGVPIVLVRPCSNLRDCPPFKSLHREDLTIEELDEWEALFLEAQSHYRDDLKQSITLLGQALAIDDQFALAHYELGKCYESLKQFDLARESYVRAREEDICPLRILSPMEQAVAAAARNNGVPFLDAHALLEAQCADGILGDQLLVDHIHPSIHGHQFIANALAVQISDEGWFTPPADWETRRQTLYDAHVKSLPNIYFLRGQRHLENLRGWAAGRAQGPPVERHGKD